MGVGKGVLWKGTYYVRPQASSFVDSSALSPVQLGSANKVCIIGDMVGLIKPKTVTRITSTLANQLLHPSCEDARLASRLVFNPSSVYAGANEVYLLSVNPSVNSTGAFGTAYSAASYIYGKAANQIKIKQEAGTTGKKVTIAYQDTTESFDNLTKSSFSIQYTGSGSACAMTINIATATRLLTTTVTGAADSISLSLNTYETIQALVDAINATGKYTAVALTRAPKTDLAAQLDNVTGQDVKTAVYTAKSDLQFIVDTINFRSGYVRFTRTTDAGAVPANFDWTYLTGGADGTITNSDWQAAFDVLKTMDMHILLPLSSDASIQSMGNSHCVYMSGPIGKSERTQFTGGAIQSWASEVTRVTSLSNVTSAALLMNSPRTVNVGLGSYHYDENGDSTLYPAYITAAMYAGIAGGGSPVLPLTRKNLNCIGLEVDLRIPEIDQMIEAGVACPIPDLVQGAGFVVSRQVTTWSGDADLAKTEFSVLRGADYIAREVRNRHELLVGNAGTAGLDTTIINVTNAVLEAAMKEELIRFYDPKKTQLRVEGTIRYVDYSAVPILPVNFIFSTYHLEPLSLTITL